MIPPFKPGDLLYHIGSSYGATKPCHSHPYTSLNKEVTGKFDLTNFIFILAASSKVGSYGPTGRKLEAVRSFYVLVGQKSGWLHVDSDTVRFYKHVLELTLER